MNSPAQENSRQTQEETLWRLLDSVTDPEIPVISIRELGILRDVNVTDGKIVVTISPTYSGCPAMLEIRSEIIKTLSNAGYPSVSVKNQLSPAWTTDWMTAQGAQKLRDYGIAPPMQKGQASVCCPQCGSANSQKISEFGSTACKALYKCNDCLEPFDYFKCI